MPGTLSDQVISTLSARSSMSVRRIVEPAM